MHVDGTTRQAAPIEREFERLVVDRGRTKTDADTTPQRAPRLRVGAVDDVAEREADRVAAEVVRSMQSPAVGPVPERPTRIRRAANPDIEVIRRAPYLANADDLIYKDSDDDTIELAFLGKQFNSNIFIRYSAVHHIRDWARSAASRLNNGGKKYAKRHSPYGSKPGRTKRGGGPAVADEDYRTVADEVREGSDAWEKINNDLDTIYSYERGELIVLDLDDDMRAQIARSILSPGPKAMPGGGGSRLPRPNGTIFTRGTVTRDAVLDAVGVAPDDRADYAALAITPLDDDQWLERGDDAKTNGENYFSYANEQLGIWFFYVSTVTSPRSANSRIQIAGESYFTDDRFLGQDMGSDLGREAAAKMQTSFRTLATPTADSGWISGRELAATRGREEGQAAAMKRWNALGAAAYANKFLGRAYDLAQNWEWLHLRGAQVGGATIGGNLVPGIYATNSAMIPFEAMIKNWAVEDAPRMSARFVATGVDGVFCSTIELWISADQHRSLGTLSGQRLASFDPLTGRVIDKMAGELVKRQIDKLVVAS